jgi:hypothetical protein
VELMKALCTLLVLLAAFPACAEITLTHLGNVRMAPHEGRYPNVSQTIATIPGQPDRLYVGFNYSTTVNRKLGLMQLPTPGTGAINTAPTATWIIPPVQVGQEHAALIEATNKGYGWSWSKLNGIAWTPDGVLCNYGKYYHVDANSYKSLSLVSHDLTTQQPLFDVDSPPHSKQHSGWLCPVPQCWLPGRTFLRGDYWSNGANGGPPMQLFDLDSKKWKWAAKYSVVFAADGNPDPTKSHTVDGWNRLDVWNGVACFEAPAADFQTGERYVIAVGMIGERPWYGVPTAPDGRVDQCNSAKGWHAWPYTAQAWVFRFSDLRKSIDGTASTWWPQPVQKIMLPGFSGCARVMCCASIGNTLIVGEERAFALDKYTFPNVLRVYQVGF